MQLLGRFRTPKPHLQFETLPPVPLAWRAGQKVKRGSGFRRALCDGGVRGHRPKRSKEFVFWALAQLRRSSFQPCHAGTSQPSALLHITTASLYKRGPRLPVGAARGTLSGALDLEAQGPPRRLGRRRVIEPGAWGSRCRLGSGACGGSLKLSTCDRPVPGLLGEIVAPDPGGVDPRDMMSGRYPGAKEQLEDRALEPVLRLERRRPRRRCGSPIRR